MSFRITGLPAEHFAPLFTMSDEELAELGAVRQIAGERTSPCRVSLTEARAGDEVRLVIPRASIQPATCGSWSRKSVIPSAEMQIRPIQRRRRYAAAGHFFHGMPCVSVLPDLLGKVM